MFPDSRELLDRFRDGDDAAATALFDRYAQRLLALARSRLSRQLARRTDAEDVVQSAYRSFFVRARSGEFTAEREGDLWRLLATITLHKLWRQVKHHRTGKRSLDREQVASGSPAIALEQIADREPSVADVIVAADELQWLLAQLEPVERQAVELRLQELPVAEIAARLGRSERSVGRWLAKARQLLYDRWADERDPPQNTEQAGFLNPIKCSPAVSSVALLRHTDYRLEALIGSGGMSKVYVGTHRLNGARVAVKVLRKRLRSRRHLVERFVQEAAVVARLSHPAIVPIHGLGRLPDGNFFLVLDLIDGTDLDQLCRREPLLPRRAAELVAAVADAIQHAHEHGVIHRDLKPGNVLIDRDSRVFVTDFGFAWFDGDLDQSIVGTSGFMAPEQTHPGSGPIGPHTDVYGLGALLFMLCCGRPPLTDGSRSPVFDFPAQSRNAIPATRLLEAMPQSVRTICERCLTRDWQRRFRSAAELAIALRAVE